MLSFLPNDSPSFFTNSVFFSLGGCSGHHSLLCLHLLLSEDLSELNEWVMASLEDITFARARYLVREVKVGAESVDARETSNARGRLSKNRVISAPFSESIKERASGNHGWGSKSGGS